MLRFDFIKPNVRRQKIKDILGVMLLFGVLSIHSCKDDEINSCKLENIETPFMVPCKLSKDIDTVKMFINGTWTWLQEEREQRGKPVQYLTSMSEGYSLELQFHGDTATYYKCNKVDAQYRFAIIRLKEISGTNFPEDEDPVLIYYNLSTGLRQTHVPILICNGYCILQYQYVSSVAGQSTWKKIQN